jgi:hypothetical protein
LGYALGVIGIDTIKASKRFQEPRRKKNKKIIAAWEKDLGN